MSKFIPVLLTLLILSSAGMAEEKNAKKEEVVRKFAMAFFTENKKDMLELSSGEMHTDVNKYFWMRENIAGANTEVREWKGRIEILSSRREKVMSLLGGISETMEDLYDITVNGKHYTVGVDDNLKVILFNDNKKETAKAP